MSSVTRLLTALACAAACVLAQAQGYPAKPVFLVLPYTAGGGMDTFLRALGQRMSEDWGQPVLVENRPGANAIIGTDYVAKSAPDGYTLLASDPQLVNNSSLYSKLPYDPFKDFVPITSLVATDHVLAVNPTLPVNNIRELIVLAKAKPGQLSYASIGIGSTFHLDMEMLQAMAGIKLNHIPYKGSLPAQVDIAAGRVQMMFVTTASVLPFAKAGKLRLLAIARARRTAQYPDLPTIAESGLPGYEVTSWYGLNAPAGTPRAVIDRINAVVRKVLADPAFREKNLDPQGLEPLVRSPEQFAAFLKSEALKWGKVVRDAKVKLD